MSYYTTIEPDEIDHTPIYFTINYTGIDYNFATVFTEPNSYMDNFAYLGKYFNE